MTRPRRASQRRSARGVAGVIVLCFGWLAAVAPNLAYGRPLAAVASFSILADMVREVGGARVVVRSLVPPDADAHVFRPTPADARTLAGADVVFINGAGFEGWLERLVRNAGYRGRVVVASEGLPLRPARGESEGEGPGGGTGPLDPHGLDPHAWHDPGLALGYVSNIRRGLSEADPDGASHYARNGQAYAERIDATAAELRALVAEVPPARRRVITAHGAFGYLGRTFGIEVLAAAGTAAGSEPSAAAVARLIRQARAQQVSALFVENITEPRLIEQIGQETGVRIGGTLYSDALSGPQGPAPTYLELLRHNLHTLVAAMRGSPTEGRTSD